MMKFFSNGMWRPRVDTIEEISVPIGERCLACGRALQADDCGVSMIHLDVSSSSYRSWHLACFQVALGIEGVKT